MHAAMLVCNRRAEHACNRGCTTAITAYLRAVARGALRAARSALVASGILVQRLEGVDRAVAGARAGLKSCYEASALYEMLFGVGDCDVGRRKVVKSSKRIPHASE